MYISVFLLHNGDPSGQEDTLGLPIHTSFVFHCFLKRPNKYFRNNVYVKLFTAIFFYKFPPLWSSILHKQIELIILKQPEFSVPRPCQHQPTMVCKAPSKSLVLTNDFAVCTVQIYSVPFGLAYSRTLTLKNCALIIIIVMGGKKKDT